MIGYRDKLTEMSFSYKLPTALSSAVDATLGDWRSGDKIRRLWQRDRTLWTGADEDDWLGWLDIVADQADHVEALRFFARDVEAGGYSDALLMGMGGSSLCPEVLSQTFGQQARHSRFHVLDSTDPAQVRTFEQRVDLSRTLFIVSSKSGTTLEPNALLQFFFDEVRQMVGTEAGARFVAVTDPGSILDDHASEMGFLHVFHGVPSIGGRFSALSHFGMVPAAAMGIDFERLLGTAGEMVDACRPDLPVEENPGAVLGVILGTAALEGRDKVTLVASPAISGLGAWLEQLLAESTGKQGKALIPVDGEAPSPAKVYGDDRLFVYLRLEPEADPEQDSAFAALEEAGQPVVRITLDDPYDLGREFFRWEFATAVAGSVMGVNPFDQPDVESSKIATRRITSEYEVTGSLPAETPIHVEEGMQLFADAANAGALREAIGDEGSFADLLATHLNRLEAGDYFALLAYLEMNQAHREELQAIRGLVLQHRKVATCLGFGPRFLHSTGQAYKGGPNSGVFLQITCEDASDIPVPGRQYTFGVIKAAQARGDFEVLAQRRRRLLRVHLGRDVLGGLRQLREIISETLV